MFEIIIKETKDVVEIVRKDWTKIGTEESEQIKGGTKEVYGYTPEIKKTVKRTVEVYKQIVEEVNLKKIIEAINGTIY